MQKFQFSQPYIHPKSYKDKEGMQVSKWFIRYKIQYAEPPAYLKKKDLVQYPKEYGNSYKRDINKINSHSEKIDNAEMLLGRVLDDLKKGIDPRNREAEHIEYVKKEIQEAEQYRAEYVFNLWFAWKNYVNPIPSKAISATTYSRFWNNQFIPYLKSIGKDYDIRKVSVDDIDNWILENYNADVWTAKTVEIKIGLLSGVFKYAFQKRFIKENPMTYVTRIKENKVIVKNGVSSIKIITDAKSKILSDNESELLYKYMNLKNEAIAKTLGYAFIRFSEIFRLRLKHLDKENWFFNIPADLAKGQRDGKTAQLKIYPKLKEVLERYLTEYFGEDRNPEYFIFYNENKNTAGTYSIFQHYFNATKSEIEKFEDVKILKSPYCFKHTGAKKFIDQNKAKAKTSYQIIEAIMKLMRHSSFITSQRYIYHDLGINLDADDDFTFD